MHNYIDKHGILKVKVMLWGLPESNTKLVLVLTRPCHLRIWVGSSVAPAGPSLFRTRPPNTVLWFGSVSTCSTSTRCTSSVPKWYATRRVYKHKENNTCRISAHDAMQLQEGPDWAIIYRVNTTDKFNRQKRFGATTWEFNQFILGWSVSFKTTTTNYLGWLIAHLKHKENIKLRT